MKLALAISLALSSTVAFGLGLGKVEVKSGLNEPLLAEIPVIEGIPGEAEALTAKLASPEDFSRVGLDARSVNVPLEFTIEKDASGKTIIRIRSELPVRESFLNFLIDVDWSKGRLLREYSLLLDPPIVAPAILGSKAVIEPVIEEPATAPEQLAPTAEEISHEPSTTDAQAPPDDQEVAQSGQSDQATPETAETAPDETAQEAEPVESAAPEEAASAPATAAVGEYGPVASGETLWEIASNTRPNNAVSMDQMMVAILRANPQAFANDNVNALKRGAVLRIPAEDEIQAVGASEARAEIVAQSQAWQQVKGTTLLTNTAPAPSTSVPAPVEERTDARLELVPPGNNGASASNTAGDRAGTDGGTELRATNEKLARANEQISSSAQEIADLKSRLGELEQLDQSKDRLLTLKDSEIAELQQKLEALRKANEASQTASVTTDAQIPPVDSTVPVDTAAATTNPVTDPGTTETAVTQEPAPAGAPGSETAAPPLENAETAQTPADGETTSPDTTASVDSQDPVTTDATATDAQSTETPADTTALPGETTPSSVETQALEEQQSATTVVTDLETRPVMPWYQDIKVIIGAGAAFLLLLIGMVFMKGRRKPSPVLKGSVADHFEDGVLGRMDDRQGLEDEDAYAAEGEDSEEHVLLKRLSQDPTDLAAHLDLLRSYYAERDAEKFETAAGAMYAQVTDPDSTEWQEVVMMGKELVPGNTLFETMPDLLGGSYAPPAAPSFGESTRVEPTAVRPKPPMVEAPKPPVVKVEPIKPAMPSLDDLSLDIKPSKPVVAPEVRAPKIEVPSLEPEKVPALSDTFLGEDTVGTKLDLAKAYLDMGDPEGAKSMLEEVVNEGSENQKSEAKRLLADIR